MSDAYPPQPDEHGLPPVGYQPPPSPPAGGRAIASMILGICSLFLWLCPIVGVVVAIIGLILGIQARNVHRTGTSMAGIVMSVIGLVLGGVNMVWGAYLGATGQHPWFQ